MEASGQQGDYTEFSATFSKLGLLIYGELLDQIYSLTQIDDNYSFNSALNFLMVKGDFYDFLQHFYQSEMYVNYAFRAFVDSVFT